MKVLVTTDLSENSRSGIRFAIQLSRQSKCSLVFYHAIEIMKPTSWNDQHYKKFADEKIAEFDAKLREFVQATFHESAAIATNCEYTVEIGTHVVEMTIACAQKKGASYLCLGTHGGGALKKLLGTTASNLLTTSPIPVIVVPANYKMLAINSLFYASDLESFETELQKVLNFARSVNAEVKMFYYDYLLIEPEDVAKIEKRYEKCRQPGLRLNFLKLDVEAPLSKHISRDVEKEKPSMLVLFTKQDRNWYNRLFLPSKSAELAFHPTVPMLVFRKQRVINDNENQ